MSKKESYLLIIIKNTVTEKSYLFVFLKKRFIIITSYHLDVFCSQMVTLGRILLKALHLRAQTPPFLWTPNNFPISVYLLPGQGRTKQRATVFRLRSEKSCFKILFSFLYLNWYAVTHLSNSLIIGIKNFAVSKTGKCGNFEQLQIIF